MPESIWKETDNCRNCGHFVEEKYCPNCGQSKSVHRFTIKTLYSDLTGNKSKLDFSYFKTFLNLIKKPGPYIRDYINGKRKYYISPKVYFLFLLGGYVFMFYKVSDRIFPPIDKSADIGFSEIQSLVKENINYFSFILPVMSAFALRIFYGRKIGLNLAEALMFSLYVYGTVFVIGILFIILVFIHIDVWGYRIIFSSLYVLYAIYSFADIKGFAGIMRGILTILTGYVFFIVLIVIVSFIYISLFVK